MCGAFCSWSDGNSRKNASHKFAVGIWLSICWLFCVFESDNVTANADPFSEFDKSRPAIVQPIERVHRTFRQRILCGNPRKSRHTHTHETRGGRKTGVFTRSAALVEPLAARNIINNDDISQSSVEQQSPAIHPSMRVGRFSGLVAPRLIAEAIVLIFSSVRDGCKTAILMAVRCKPLFGRFFVRSLLCIRNTSSRTRTRPRRWGERKMVFRGPANMFGSFVGPGNSGSHAQRQRHVLDMFPLCSWIIVRHVVHNAAQSTTIYVHRCSCRS